MKIPMKYIIYAVLIVAAAGGFFAYRMMMESSPKKVSARPMASLTDILNAPHDHAPGESCGADAHDHAKEDTKAHRADDGHDHSHDGEAECPAEALNPAISETALKNYGVTFMTVKKDSYVPYTTIPARIDQMTGADWVFSMALGGQINEILVKPGEAVRPGQPLVRILRDPVPRPELTFTGNFLRPEVKMLRESASEFAKISRVLTNLQRELKRLKDAQTETTAGTLIPKKDIIDLENQVAEQGAAENGQRQGLRAFGYTEEELGQLATGVFIVPNTGNWIEALKTNDYWSAEADTLLSLLPENVRQHYWTVAGIGELHAMGLFTDEILDAAQKSKALCNGWTDAASLLIQGYSIRMITQWADQGWLEPIVKVALPSDLREAGFDVEEITAKQGQHLSAGAEILTVANHEEMQLLCTPVGSELKLLNQALVSGAPLAAKPVIEGTGIPVQDLAVVGFISGDDGENTAVIPVTNRLMKPHGKSNREPRVWGLRRGMKYLLQIPSGKPLNDVYVVPSSAITDFGTEKVVIVKHGDHYEVRTVVVLAQDGESAVLNSAASELKPGEIIAATGAFRLNLALQRGKGGETVDPHAGHNH